MTAAFREYPASGALHRARLFAREARAYLRSAGILFAKARADRLQPGDRDNTNPTYFLLLHACELAIKSVGLSRGHGPNNSHDIIALIREFARPSDRTAFRHVRRMVRQHSEGQINRKWDQLSGEHVEAARRIELETLASKSLRTAETLRLLGALGQTEMTKFEFGSKVETHWHSVRYPRFGHTGYPDFEVCALLCEGLIAVAEGAFEDLEIAAAT